MSNGSVWPPILLKSQDLDGEGIAAHGHPVRNRLRTGCPWRLLPREYPRWQVVYSHVSQWSGHGTVEQVQAAVREGVRPQQGRGRRPTGAIMDSQRAKGSNVADARTIDGGGKGQGAQAAPGR